MQQGFPEPHLRSATPLKSRTWGQSGNCEEQRWIYDTRNPWGTGFSRKAWRSVKTARCENRSVFLQCSQSFLSERRKGLHGGWRRREVGSPSAKREGGEKRASLPPTCSIFRLFYPCSAPIKLRRASRRPSLTLTPLLQHAKQLHGQKRRQEATGAKNKKTPQPLTTTEKSPTGLQ